MKKIAFFLFLITSLNADNYFEFVSNKSGGPLSRDFMKKMVETFHCDNFFETGTYLGETTLLAASYYNQVYTVELYGPVFHRTIHKLNHHNIHAYLGNSSQIIENIAGTLQGKTLFWLDAHYSGEGTGKLSSGAPEAFTAIREELEAIYKAGLINCVILIDDIRGFGTEIDGHIFPGCWCYPTVQEVKTALLKINPNFGIFLLGDTLLAYDPADGNPQFSPTVQACTKTRFFDGSNLTIEELLACEDQIQQAPPPEAAFITYLYELMTNYSDPMIWHDMWYGLVQFGKGNFAGADAAFQKVENRIDSSKQFRDPSKTIPYRHPSLAAYREKCRGSSS